MVAGDVTAPPRKVLIISAGASHSVALLSMSLTLFVGLQVFIRCTWILLI